MNYLIQKDNMRYKRQNMEFNNHSPIYTQIADFFKNKIASGAYSPGERIESVRELAMSMGVNPNTMQRALSELERDGYLYTERTSGRYITKDANLIQELRKNMVGDLIDNFIQEMLGLGFQKEELLMLLKNRLEP